MAENRQYDHEYKVQAVKLAKEIGQAKAAKELGIPKNTMYGWVRANRLGNLDLGAGSPRRKPNGITKADREARKSDDLLKRDFRAEEPLTKCVTDITEIKARDGKLYVSAIFDC